VVGTSASTFLPLTRIFIFLFIAVPSSGLTHVLGFNAGCKNPLGLTYRKKFPKLQADLAAK
jgi:hypothetical protein